MESIKDVEVKELTTNEVLRELNQCKKEKKNGIIWAAVFGFLAGGLLFTLVCFLLYRYKGGSVNGQNVEPAQRSGLL